MIVVEIKKDVEDMRCCGKEEQGFDLIVCVSHLIRITSSK